MTKFDYQKFAQSWPAPVVARSEVGKFSGGLLNPRTLANLDCLGLGPPRIRFGKKQIGYPVNDLVIWLEARSKEIVDAGAD